MAVTINSNGTITGIAAGGLPDGVVDTDTLAADAVTAAKMADDVVNSEHLVDGGVDNAHLATGIASSKLSGTLPALDGSALTAVLTRAKGVSSTYDVSTASGTQDVTGFGFNPRFVIGFGSIEGTDTTFMGWTEVGTLDRCTAERGDNGNSYAQGQFPAAQIDGSNKCNSVVSSITDGVRFTWTKIGSPTGTLQLYLLGFK